MSFLRHTIGCFSIWTHQLIKHYNIYLTDGKCAINNIFKSFHFNSCKFRYAVGWFVLTYGIFWHTLNTFTKYGVQGSISKHKNWPNFSSSLQRCLGYVTKGFEVWRWLVNSSDKFWDYNTLFVPLGKKIWVW